MKQLNLFKIEERYSEKDTTFSGGKGEIFHDWYPYLEGYSSKFVKSIQEKYLKNAKKIIDPFCGVGTTITSLSNKDIICGYCEVNPVLQKIVDTKNSVLKLTLKEKKSYSKKLFKISQIINKNIKDFEKNEKLNINYKNTFKKSIYFNNKNFEDILRIRTLNNQLFLKDKLLSDLLTVGVFSILIKSSKLKRMGDLRFKNKKELNMPQYNFVSELNKQLNKMSNDILDSKYINLNNRILSENSKDLINEENFYADGVITSPPYLNGTNYIRNTKLELWYMLELNDINDLRKFRDKVITSGINDVNSNINKDSFLKATTKLIRKIEAKEYDKRISKMIGKYFVDMNLTFIGLAKHLKTGSKMLIDIGDSKFCGVHIKTDFYLKQIAKKYFKHNKTIKLRTRLSNDKTKLKQVLIIFERNSKSLEEIKPISNVVYINPKWEYFKKKNPHKQNEYAKRNWGSKIHSLCSYQGKLKPSIAHFLIDAFSKQGDKILDPFSGSGTIPLEAALNGRKAFALDISTLSHSISTAKLKKPNRKKIFKIVNNLKNFISLNKNSESDIYDAKLIKFNKSLNEYFHKDTFTEILKARRFFKYYKKKKDHSYYFVLSSLLHILHGNRPYALSRRSHPLTPYSPTGERKYKNLIEKVSEKINRGLDIIYPNVFIEGNSYQGDILSSYPKLIRDIDCIITSPPFYQSTKFYMTNWMRYWFCGWNKENFNEDTNLFIENKQLLNINIYNNIFINFKKILKKNGLIVLHLGKNSKMDMGEEILKIAKSHFKIIDLHNEDVSLTEKHGLRDKGSVISHQYLILKNI